MKVRALRKRRQSEMQRWIRCRGPFVRITDIPRGRRWGGLEIGKVESMRFVAAPHLMPQEQ